jgi:hypothetical protein
MSLVELLTPRSTRLWMPPSLRPASVAPLHLDAATLTLSGVTPTAVFWFVAHKVG